MSKHDQKCESCGAVSEGEIYHLGFSDMDCMYCDSCPSVLLLKERKLREKHGVKFPHLLPGDEGWQEYNRHLLPFYEKLESLFKPCSCGGKFTAWAKPRCPKCNQYLFKGEPEQNKPSTWSNKYVFVTKGSITDVNHLATKNA